jgi:hypothetical protein
MVIAANITNANLIIVMVNATIVTSTSLLKTVLLNVVFTEFLSVLTLTTNVAQSTNANAATAPSSVTLLLKTNTASPTNPATLPTGSNENTPTALPPAAVVWNGTAASKKTNPAMNAKPVAWTLKIILSSEKLMLSSISVLILNCVTPVTVNASLMKKLASNLLKSSVKKLPTNLLPVKTNLTQFLISKII